MINWDEKGVFRVNFANYVNAENYGIFTYRKWSAKGYPISWKMVGHVFFTKPNIRISWFLVIKRSEADHHAEEEDLIC